MNGLDNLLNQEEPEEERNSKRNTLTSLRITNYAFEKAYGYAKIACDIAEGTIECGGYLITPKGTRDRVATDSFLAKNQDVSDGLFTIEAEDVIKAGSDIDGMGYKVLGWWHSHAHLDTFFSATDDDGQMTVLNEIAAINYITRRETKDVDNLVVRVRDGRIVMYDKRSPERKYQFELNRKASKDLVSGLKLIQEKKVGFAYGLVVNVKEPERKPYAEIAIRDLCGFCRNSHDESAQVGVELYEDGDFVIDEDSLRKEIKERVKMRPKFFRFGRGRKYKGQPFFPQTQIPGQYDSSFNQTEFGDSSDTEASNDSPDSLGDGKIGGKEDGSQ
jgi:proteasome lid subunit RPN8/RPN11